VPEINLSGATLASFGGERLALEDYRGTTVLVVLGNQRTSKRLPALVERLFAETGGELPIVQIAHLRGVPRMLHGVAERDIRRSVERLRETLAGPGDAARRRIAIGLDWKGDVTSRFAFTARSPEAVVAVLDEDLAVVCRNPDGQQLAALAAKKEHA
jgi:hypothetical protein